MLQLPLVYLFAWRYGTWGSRADLLLLGFGVIGGIGLSCTGLLMMPAAVLMGLASTFSFDGAWARRSAFGMVAAVYPLLAAWLLHPGLDTLAASLKDWPLETLGQILSDVFGPYGRYAILWSIMTSWVFVRSPMPRKWMLLGGIIVFLGIFNPYLTPFIKLHVTSAPAFWRVAWLYPSAIALSVAIAELGCRPRRIVFRLVSYCFLLALGLFLAERMGGFALRTSNGTFWGFGKLDIPAAEYDASREIAKLAPKESAAVVPETVAPWLETMPEHPKLVYVRRHYLLYFEPTLGRDEVERRLKIWSLINEEKSGVSPDYLLREIQPLNIGCITLDLRKTVAPAVGSMLEGLGWSHTVSGHYVIWIRPS